jgi:hypothetical protein
VAVDLKYGKVTTENGNIGDDEPVVVFRAQDELLGHVLTQYHLLCMVTGSPDHHLTGILRARKRVLEWQRDNKTKIPTSDSLAR